MKAKTITRIQEIFFASLQAKTGWGRREIKDLYSAAVMQALVECEQ